MKQIDKHIESIVTRRVSSKITKEEQIILDNWLSESKDNVAFLNDFEKIYVNSANPLVNNFPSIDIDVEWKKFKHSIDSENTQRKTFSPWLRIAASIALVAIAGYVLWFTQFKSNSIHIVAQTWGEVITLPDSSRITLNKGAELIYPKEFSSKERTVALKGEAFFEVTRNENKPFVVNLSQSRVEVLGTSFNINANDRNNITEVVVSTGKVRFSNTTLSQSVILTKGEKGTLMRNTQNVTKTLNSDVNIMAWKTRKIVFNDMELDKVIRTINRLYDAQISFSTDIGVNCNVTVSFENQSLEAVLSVLELTLNLKYKKSGDAIVITKTGC